MKLNDTLQYVQGLEGKDLLKNMELVASAQHQLAEVLNGLYVYGLGGMIKDKKDVDMLIAMLSYENIVLDVLKRIGEYIVIYRSQNNMWTFLRDLGLLISVLKIRIKMALQEDEFKDSIEKFYSKELISSVINTVDKDQGLKLLDVYIVSLKKGLAGIQSYENFGQEHNVYSDMDFDAATNKDLDVLSYVLEKGQSIIDHG